MKAGIAVGLISSLLASAPGWAQTSATATASTSTTSVGDPAIEAREADIFGSDDDEAVRDEREADLFGDEGDGDERADEVFGSAGEGSLARIEQTMEDTEDFLAIGGELWLWLEYTAVEDMDAESLPLSSPSFLDLYADARPNDRLRAFVQGRLLYDPTVTDGAVDLFGQERRSPEVRLDQYWLKFDIFRRVFATIGRQRIRWGASRFWNPTDFLNERLDPLAVFDRRLGVGLIKLHLPLEAYGWNFYAIANLEEASPVERVGGALRAEILVGQTEVSLSTALRKGEPIRLGADLSSGISWFDVRAELAVLHRVRTPFFEGDFRFPQDLSTFQLDDLELPTEVSRRDDWIPQLVLGAEVTIPYGDEDNLFLGVEYFFNDAGYANENLYPWLIGAGQFTPLYLGRHYAAAYGLLAAPGRWDDTTFLASVLGNLSDGSFVGRLDYSVVVLTYLSVNVFGQVYFGSEGELRFGLTVPPIPAGLVPPEAGIDLSQGLNIEPPMFNVGTAVRLRI